MTIGESKQVLQSLVELTVHAEFVDNKVFKKMERQNIAIKIMNRFIENLEHQQKAQKLGCGILDSLTECPKCKQVTLIIKMAGGYECKNPECNYGEIAF